MPKTTSQVRHVSITIHRPAADVQRYVADGANMPAWAHGVGHGVERVGDAWVADGPMGRVTVRFADANSFGVLDHEVILPSGERFYNPLRVVTHANGDGSELIFTVFRLPGVSDSKFEEDVQAVTRDLTTLKSLLER
jgi:hypothetical protein